LCYASQALYRPGARCNLILFIPITKNNPFPHPRRYFHSFSAGLSFYSLMIYPGIFRKTPVLQHERLANHNHYF
ncbi:hypothetical protein ACLD2C_21190, partial [Salmonella sp. 741265130_HBA]|uniref:hypothetical protein n=1 Tax=Salmonella sp. 741265130_HBA TaxID=3389049 RepID=UPI00398028E6